jgi:hypothetical protein
VIGKVTGKHHVGDLSLFVWENNIKMNDHLHPVPRSVNAWSYTSTPPIRLHGMVLSLKKITGTLPLPYLTEIGCEDVNWVGPNC